MAAAVADSTSRFNNNFGYAGVTTAHSGYFGNHHTGVVFTEVESPKKDNYRIFVQVKGSNLPPTKVRLPTEFRKTSTTTEKPIEDSDIEAFHEHISNELDLRVRSVALKSHTSTSKGQGGSLLVSLADLAAVGAGFPFVPGMSITAEVDESPRRIRKSLRGPTATSAGEGVDGIRPKQAASCVPKADCVLM